MSRLGIALSGKMASGKSLVARYLTSNYEFTEFAFATRLKEICAEMFGIDPVKKSERDRLILQQFAQYMREIDPMVWVRYMIQRIPLDDKIIISDVRFPNEHHTLKNLGFIMVRMVMDRPTQEEIVAQNYPDLPLILLDDYSERAVDDKYFDYRIQNGKDVTLKQVYAQVDSMLGDIWLKSRQ